MMSVWWKNFFFTLSRLLPGKFFSFLLPFVSICVIIYIYSFGDLFTFVFSLEGTHIKYFFFFFFLYFFLENEKSFFLSPLARLSGEWVEEINGNDEFCTFSSFFLTDLFLSWDWTVVPHLFLESSSSSSFMFVFTHSYMWTCLVRVKSDGNSQGQNFTSFQFIF